MARKRYQSDHHKYQSHKTRREREERDYKAVTEQLKTDPNRSEYFRKVTSTDIISD